MNLLHYSRTLLFVPMASGMIACASTSGTGQADDAEASASQAQEALAACPFNEGQLPAIEHALWTPVLEAGSAADRLDAAEAWLHEVREEAMNLFADISEEHVQSHAEEQRAFLETWSYGDESLLVVEDGRFTVADRAALALAEDALEIGNTRAAAEWVRRSGATVEGDATMDRCYAELKELSED